MSVEGTGAKPRLSIRYLIAWVIARLFWKADT